jgi:acyl-CoA reductase-like NAD-dependent aldehyde dehydrogenase
MATASVPTFMPLIAGADAPAATSAVIEPAGGALLAHVGVASPEHAAEAVARATEAAAAWAATPPAQRGAILRNAARLIEEHGEDLAQLEARNVGKPIATARPEIGGAAAVFDYYAGAAATLEGRIVPVSAPGLDLALREPVGVCALIVPWNFPLFIAAIKGAPALAAGNPLILKPAELTPLTALRLGQILLEAGVPAGCVSVLPGEGAVVGRALVADRAVSKVSFTGSTEVGVDILRTAAPNVSRVSLELGGKSSNVIFADADLDVAAASAVSAVFGNAGQDCCARSRIIVEQSIHDDFVERFTAAALDLRIGDPLDEATQMGPLISETQRDRVLAYVRAGLEAGADLAFGGGAPSDAGLRDGPFVAPTLFTGASSRMRIAQEEIFGPVAMMLTFADEGEAVALANDVDYGLSGSIWTNDLGRAVRVSRAIRSGALSVNSNQSVHVEAPFGGVKRSGLGRELGLEALKQFTDIKNVYIAVD